MENFKPNSTQAKWKERWSRKAVQTIRQIWYAPQCGTVLLIWELGLLNLSFHYSNRNPRDICSLQFSCQWALSVVSTVKSGSASTARQGRVCSATSWTTDEHLPLTFSHFETAGAFWSLTITKCVLIFNNISPITAFFSFFFGVCVCMCFVLFLPFFSK